MDKHTEVLKKLAEAMNAFTEIPKEDKHPSDTLDFVFHIHALQNLVYTEMYIKEHGPI
jgi:hypothetical protein